jgi:hypothetical protein
VERSITLGRTNGLYPSGMTRTAKRTKITMEAQTPRGSNMLQKRRNIMGYKARQTDPMDTQTQTFT